MSYWNDGREPRVLEHLKSLPESERNTPSAILSAIDKWSNQSEKTFLMNIGPDKGKIITVEIEKVKPKIMAELGGYVGYSSILFASKMVEVHGEEERKKGNVKYLSLEQSEQFAGIMREVIGMAGLSDVITVVVGSSSDSLKRLPAEYGVEKLDILYIDHFENFFVPDIRIAESIGLVRPGVTVICDNILFPGAPQYAKYIRYTPDEKKKKFPDDSAHREVYYDSSLHHSKLEVGGKTYEDAVEISRCAGYLHEN